MRIIAYQNSKIIVKPFNYTESSKIEFNFIVFTSGFILFGILTLCTMDAVIRSCKMNKSENMEKNDRNHRYTTIIYYDFYIWIFTLSSVHSIVMNNDKEEKEKKKHRWTLQRQRIIDIPINNNTNKTKKSRLSIALNTAPFFLKKSFFLFFSDLDVFISSFSSFNRNTQNAAMAKQNAGEY